MALTEISHEFHGEEDGKWGPRAKVSAEKRGFGWNIVDIRYQYNLGTVVFNFKLVKYAQEMRVLASIYCQFVVNII